MPTWCATLRPAIEPGEPKVLTPPELTEAQTAAIDTIFEDVKERSADIVTFTREFVREFIAEEPRDEARVLLDGLDTAEDRAQFIARALAIRNIPARVLHGMSLGEPKAFQQLQPYLQVHNGSEWVVMSITTAEEGLPENFFLWTRSPRDLLSVDSDRRPKVEFAVQRNLADAVAIATRRTEVRSENLVKYSLLGLPVEMQGVYRILLTVPIGAFVMLILRNVIGFKTFGTFMPVLIALAFRETKIISGVILLLVGRVPGLAGALLSGAITAAAGAATDQRTDPGDPADESGQCHCPPAGYPGRPVDPRCSRW